MIEFCNLYKYKLLNSNNFNSVCICLCIHKTVCRKDYFLPTMHNLWQSIVPVFLFLLRLIFRRVVVNMSSGLSNARKKKKRMCSKLMRSNDPPLLVQRSLIFGWTTGLLPWEVSISGPNKFFGLYRALVSHKRSKRRKSSELSTLLAWSIRANTKNPFHMLTTYANKFSNRFSRRILLQCFFFFIFSNFSFKS